MRLKAIKLSGFKSFVDPTTIPINGNLTGIVGPNGCGKSNIIDAIRWVMGESSAKHLRGDSMADVVFNGSNSRKPVAQASVELVFDNSDGGAGGEYAKYAEIAIRREAGRDGQSDYFLNRTRCRRKDITDLFLGTGLGPRAYSIIEQGMVTRIIEAKPEDLRGFIEEAAGISRYKERRRETENRIRHARENLARVEDIRKELETQLNRLEKQSKAAARYKELKQEERLVRAQLGALRYRDLDARVQEQDRALAQHQNALDAALAAQRENEAEIERLRASHAEAHERFNEVQSRFYGLGAEISKLEQAIEHARETRANQQREQEQLNRAWDESAVHLRADHERHAELSTALEALKPRLEQHATGLNAAAEALAEAERAMQTWQRDWETFTHETAEQAKSREIQGTRRIQLEQQIADLESRQQRLEEEWRAIEPQLAASGAEGLRRDAETLDRACEEQERALAGIEVRLRETREARAAAERELDALRAPIAESEGKLASLRHLQSAAAGEDDGALVEWLRGRGLDRAPRLAGALSVESGWERALERVLGPDLVAMCVESLESLAAQAESLKPGHLAFVDVTVPAAERAAGGAATLLDKIQSNVELTPLLAGIYVAETLDEALARRTSLAANESIVTRGGALVGRNWLSLSNDRGGQSGWLEREREIAALERELAGLRAEAQSKQARLVEMQDELTALEASRNDSTHKLNESLRERARLREQLGHSEAQLTQLGARRDQIQREREEIEGLLARDRAAIEEAASLLRAIEAGSAEREARRDELARGRESAQAALDAARTREREARDELHRAQVERQGLQTAHDSTSEAIRRLESQLAQLTARREELAHVLAADNQPEVEFKQRLDALLGQRLEIEAELNAARTTVGEIEAALRTQEQSRHQHERAAQEVREQMEGEKVARQELLVRRDTLVEQVREVGFELAQVLAELPPEAAEAAWVEQLEKIGNRIERLGPINLVAIEEYTEQSQRKEYLDRQHADLSQALATLEEAIRKIDRETRTRFKETYDKVNDNFQGFFPKLFGGGSAYLDLTDSDLLETGVSVMARPPGKRNSTIHLLSGGEKALTAVALLFSIFELNPAPFCLLDEVDAPLDDANVERYSQTLKAMSDRTQLMYVTHNKITMEMADVLVGVTMSEPGVSRLVAVDVAEALKMVAQA
jgi:chromosome segregation protein